MNLVSIQLTVLLSNTSATLVDVLSNTVNRSKTITVEIIFSRNENALLLTVKTLSLELTSSSL